MVWLNTMMHEFYGKARKAFTFYLQWFYNTDRNYILSYNTDRMSSEHFKLMLYCVVLFYAMLLRRCVKTV